MKRKHFFIAAALILFFTVSGCIEITPPEFNNPSDPFSSAYKIPEPSNLAVSLRGTTSVLLQWQDSWTYEKGYIVERSVGGGPFEKIADLPALTKEYVDSGLDTTKSYSYRVKRFTDLAVSGYSRVAHLQPPAKGSIRMNVISSAVNFAGAFSHDRNFLATVYNSKYNQILFWKVPQYDIDKIMDPAGISVKVMSFSADDKLLACGTEDSSIYIYDVNSKTLSFTIKGIKAAVTSLDFSPNGKFMAAALKSKDILVYNTNSWTIAYTLSRHAGFVNSVSFSKDGALMASGSADGTIILWNTSDWTVNRTITTGESNVMSAAFRPDGQVIAAAAGMSYCQYETTTGNKIRSFSTGSQAAISVAFSNDGKNFAGTCGTGVSIYDSNNMPFTLDYGGSPNSSYSFNCVLAAQGDGAFVTVGYPVAVWLPGSWTISYQ